jgi:hypothetical protein
VPPAPRLAASTRSTPLAVKAGVGFMGSTNFKASFALWLMGFPMRVVREAQWIEAMDEGRTRDAECIQYLLNGTN